MPSARPEGLHLHGRGRPHAIVELTVSEPVLIARSVGDFRLL